MYRLEQWITTVYNVRGLGVWEWICERQTRHKEGVNATGRAAAWTPGRAGLRMLPGTSGLS